MARTLRSQHLEDVPILIVRPGRLKGARDRAAGLQQVELDRVRLRGPVWASQADLMTLQKIEMRTIGRSPYKLRNEPATLSEVVEPGKEALVTFTMWSISDPQRLKRRDLIYVDGFVHYESPKGTFKQPFSGSFREP